MQQILALGFIVFLAHGAGAQVVAAGAPTPDVVVTPQEDVQVVPPNDDAIVEPQPLPPVATVVPTLKVLNAPDVSLSDFEWIARPVVVFADSPADPRFQEQIDLLLARPAALIDRDVVVVTDTDPDARTDVRLKLRPRGFMLTLIDKDGTINLRKPSPWDVRELTRAIDKMPSRQQEIRERKEDR